jgi:hypothetical protein
MKAGSLNASDAVPVASHADRIASESPSIELNPERVAIEDTQKWLMEAVIGLNLCPFAKAVVVKDKVRYRV